MRKLKSGVYGLNPLLDGGINENSSTVVIGCSGAGKTTFATQFIRRGLEAGQEGIFVSLDENKEQIIKEAIEMGWKRIIDYIEEERLVFIDASGQEFSTFIKKELPGFVADWKGGANARISIDPLTPVMWSVTDRYEQRELIGFMLKETRKVGTVLATLEEHGTAGDLSGGEAVIPMYLADCVIHLRNFVDSEAGLQRRLKVMKCRNSRHSKMEHSYSIVKGLGLVVNPGESRAEPSRAFPERLKNMLDEHKGRIPARVHQRIIEVLEELRDEDFNDMSPEEVVEEIIQEYED
ncbi:MAG: circadian clock protein KaiC [Candidatus Proteinoplasmatales archaeon SG8-5]|nr:MAG: circadian clock protein KaiC [Candidatus Proteinoplasmatales archaeon SG8-5]